MTDDETLIKEWLEECRTESTRKLYAHQIKAFQAWYGKSLSTFLALEPKEMRHMAIKFQNELIGKGVNPNSIATMVASLGSLCSQNGKPLLLKGKRVRLQMDVDSHIFTNGDLAAMFDVADTQEKAVMATFTSLGWEVSSIITLKRDFINSLVEKARADNQEYVYFKNQRQKTGALRLGVLNPLALEWLEKWFREWHGETIFQIVSKEGMNRIFRRLAQESQIKTTGSVHSHQIRKWVMSGLSRAGFNDFQIKYVMGKTIPASDATYLLTLEEEIRERYPPAFQNYLNIKQSPGAVTSLAKAMTEKDRKIEALEKDVAELRDLVMKQTETMQRLIEKVKEKA